jgi:cell shape-determining protein MreC
MTYIQRSSNNQKSGFKKFFWIAILVVAIFLVSMTNIFGSFVGFVTQPFFAKGESLGSNLSFAALLFGDKATLAEQVQNLEAELQEFKAREADFSAVNYENERLRGELQMKPRGAMLHASIIARSPQIPLDALLTNIGTVDGAKENDLVFASDRSVIGKVSKLTRDTSTVLLNSSPLLKNTGFIARTGNAIEVQGAGSNSLEAQVPIDFDIQIGDSVVVSHTSDNVIAVVGAIEEDKVIGNKKILMSLPVNPAQIKSVFILPTPAI